MRSVRGVIGWAAGVGVLIAVAGVLTYWSFPRPIDREWAHVARVLLTDQFSDGAARPVQRWARPFRVAAVGGTNSDYQALARMVRDVNALIRESKVALRGVEPGDTDLLVAIFPSFEHGRLAEKVGFMHDSGRSGMAWTEFNDRHESEFAIAFASSDLPESTRAAVILHEVAHALGFRNHSPYFKESIFYEDASGDYAIATRLAPIDRKLIRFLYLYLEPGDRLEDVRRAFDRWWRNMSVPPEPPGPSAAN